MLYWWGIILAMLLFIPLAGLGEAARLAGRRLKPGFALAFALGFLGLLCTLMFVAFSGLSADDPSAGMRLAAAFAIPIIGGLFAVLGLGLARLAVRPTPDGAAKVPRGLDVITQRLPNELADPPLGRLRAPIDVTRGTNSLLITVPVRRSAKTLAFGAALMAPGVFLIARLIYVLLAAVFGGMSASSLLVVGSIGVLGNLMMNIPFWLAAAWGAHLLYGEEVVAVDRHRVLLRKTVWGVGLSVGVLDVQRSVAVRSDRDQQGYWHVVLEPDPPATGMNRSVHFGAGNLTHEQAEALAQAVREYFALSPGGTPSV